MNFTRRHFLASLGAVGALAAGFSLPRRKSFPVRMAGANAKTGHLLRGQAFPRPSHTEGKKVLIVGGGIAGLSAAWQLQRRGFNDFELLELAESTGGNAMSGKNEVSSFPWGAHYIPLPTDNLVHVFELFEELGVIEKYVGGRPFYNEEYLCHDPHERHYRDGKWREGIIDESEDYQRFLAVVASLKKIKTSDGRPAFSLPLDLGTRDARITDLDKISLADFLKGHDLQAPELLWYLNYCCRDDFGTSLSETSAWAGLHYFASRGGVAANAEKGTVLTWPAGNGWIVDRLAQKLRAHLKTNQLVYRIDEKNGEITTSVFEPLTGRAKQIKSEAVIFAAPRFVAGKLIADFRTSPPEYLKAFSYAPWLVANLTLKKKLRGEGVQPAWDNILFDSESLGYVDATHQTIRRYSGKTVITYYLPLSQQTPTRAREIALAKTNDDWASLIVNDLSKAHPDLRENIVDMSLWIWGHGMIRPTPGFIWGNARQAALNPHKTIFFAHSDMSGLSLFEEAQYRGVKAATQVLKQIGFSRGGPA